MLIVKPKPQSVKAWVVAARPKTLLLSITPIAVGTFLAPVPFKQLNWSLALCTLGAAVAMQIATNMINDAVDFKRGADTKHRLGPQRATQSGLLTDKQVLSAGFGTLIVAAILALPMMIVGGLPFILLTAIALLCSYMYTAGPFPIAYKGLGELFVILFYGLMATLCPYYLQTGELSAGAWVASLQLGLLASAPLAINNLRDIEEDTKSHKRTLAVRFGRFFGKWEITFLMLAPFIINIYWLSIGRYLTFILPCAALFMVVNLLRGIWKHSPSRLYNRYLGEAAMITAIFGLLIVLGERIL